MVSGLKCPECGSKEITMIWDLEKQHCGGNKWCLGCGRIFDGKSNEEKICDTMESYDILCSTDR